MLQKLCIWIARRAVSRPPDFVIGDLSRPYLMRWHLIKRNRFFNIYLHQIIRSDDDRALHDHPWWNASYVFMGGYIEVVPMRQEQPGFDDFFGRIFRLWRPAGSWVFRRGNFRHRLEVVEGRQTWSLFFTGPVYRKWGFYCKQGFVDHDLFTSAANSGQIGKGCDQ